MELYNYKITIIKVINGTHCQLYTVMTYNPTVQYHPEEDRFLESGFLSIFNADVILLFLTSSQGDFPFHCHLWLG